MGQAHLNQKTVGTSVPTSDGHHPRPSKAPHKKARLKLDYHIPPIWPAFWVAFLLINIIFGLLAPEHDLLILFRVGSIVACLIYVAKIFPEDRLLLLAMFTTCISDIILALNNTSELGLTVFLATQIVHLYRLEGTNHHRHIIAFAGFSGAIIILDLLFSLIPLLFLIVALYAVALTLNVLASHRWRHREPTNLRAHFAFLGFTLFACCDLCTCLSYLSLIAVLPAFFYIPANFFAWFFYYPSQLLISNSGYLSHSAETHPPKTALAKLHSPKTSIKPKEVHH